MDRIPGQNVTQWTPGSKDLLYERLITRVEGHRIFLDAPVCNSFDQRYGGGTVYKYEFPERIQNVGIENLGGDSDFHSPTDEDHSWEFIRIDRTQNAWVRNITARHFAYAAVNIGESARSVTVEDSACLDPVSQVTGSRRYSFNVDGQMCLVRGVRTRSGRHDFVQGSLTHGPNVFLRSRAERALDESGPHHRWSTGTLFDNVTVEGNALAAWNRGASGTGHGWSGANMVFWNCQARWFRVQNPFTAQNWVIGGIGDLAVVKDFLNGPAGIFDSHGRHVSLGDWPDNPDNSLYVAQLAERLSDPGGPPREYTLGDYDEFGDDGPGSEDQAPVSPDWLERVGQYAASQGAVVGRMDLAAPRQFVPFTFEFGVEPGERIVAATLTLAVQRSGAADRSVSIWLGRMDDEYRFISGGLQPGGSQGEEGAAIIMLEVPQPWLALLGEGRLNAAVSGALAVDWARLDVVAAPPAAGAEGPVSRGRRRDRVAPGPVQVSERIIMRFLPERSMGMTFNPAKQRLRLAGLVLLSLTVAAGAAEVAKYDYRVLATTRTSTMQKELREVGQAGLKLLGLTVAKTAFGGSEVVSILGKETP